MSNETWISIAAWGDWHHQVPRGMVCVEATVDGKRCSAGKYFLVSSSEYQPGMPVDPQRHAELKGFVPFHGSKRHSHPATAAVASGGSEYGTAKPWSEVLRSLGASGGSKARTARASLPPAGTMDTENADAVAGSAKPWKEVLSQIEAKERMR